MQHFEEAKTLFQGTDVKITSEGKKHLGATIGSDMYQKDYINSKIDIWTQDLSLLSELLHMPIKRHMLHLWI